MPHDWLHTFTPFTAQHLACVLLFGGLIAALCITGRFWRHTPAESTLRRAIGITALILWIAHQFYWLQPTNFTWSRSLPLHICDLAGLAAPLSILLPSRTLAVLTYFWAMVLTSQGFVTPVLTEGPVHLRFWFFWLTHTAVICIALYSFTAGTLIITARDLIRAILITTAIAFALLMLNLITGWNYAYVGNQQTSQPTLIDALGPWPWRLLPLAAIGILGFVLAWLPWGIAARFARTQP